MTRRFIVAACIFEPQGKLLLCHNHPTRGVFPNLWGVPGGGMEEGETLEQALRREVREEVGLELSEFTPFEFKDETREKIVKSGERQEIYMVYLNFTARTPAPEQLVLNDEWQAAEWVEPRRALTYNLNPPTRETLTQLLQ